MAEPSTGASDLYSLGVMLFEMLTGEAPFRRKCRPQRRTKPRTPERKPPTERKAQPPVPAKPSEPAAKPSSLPEIGL